MRDLQSVVSEYMKGKKHLHLEIGIVTRGDIEYHSFGNSPKQSTVAPEHRLFEIGSLTKVFTSILLLELEHQQRLSSDDTVNMYIDHGKNDYLNKITLKHLATHTSGLPRLATNLSSKNNRYNPYVNYKEQDLLTFLADADYTDQIDSFEYSNTGVGLLGYILCKVAGSTYDDLLKTYIADPLNLTETAALLNAEQNGRLVDGHTSTGKIMPHWDLSVHDGAGAIKSSLHDMCLFAQANLNEDHPLAPTMQQSHIPVRVGDSDLYYGWQEDTVSDQQVLWHNGGTFGFSSYLAINKEQGVGVVVLSNYCFGSASRVDEYLDAIYKFLTKKDLYPLTFLDPVGKNILESLLQK
ncbi:Protein flp [Paenibacillus sp. JJ-100]|uniref:serine hydrolase domain-containing protein n=1 Tax=Paenibacillus sp. JJ-100 TaxID=2974896 RepID=UPI0022FF9D12|nr:serine hydrolase domain-containing protein [Paenibacillus sp. JJ-100]CAI6084341.1 Protein flp [Paenibacillus sp. JJ-100]